VVRTAAGRGATWRASTPPALRAGGAMTRATNPARSWSRSSSPRIDAP